MTMEQAMDQGNLDVLYGLDPDEKHPILATDEYRTAFNRYYRCYVVITDISTRQWINLHIHRGADQTTIAREYKAALKAAQALCGLCRECKDSTKWRVLSLADLEELNKKAYNKIPHLRESHLRGPLESLL